MELATFRSLSIGDTITNRRGHKLPVTNQYTKVIEGVPVSHVEVITRSDGALTLTENDIDFI